jgi:hypothetical protein
MTSVPGVDLPEEQTEAEVALPGGVSVSTRVEFVGDGVIVVRPSLGEYADQAVASAGAPAEVFWKGPESQRSRPAAVLSVEQGAVVRWRLEPTGPAEDSQRRQAVRARVELPLVIRYAGVDLSGSTVDISEAGLRGSVDGFGLPPDAGSSLEVRLELEDGEVATRGEVVRIQPRGSRWHMSIRYTDIAEKHQDRLRRRVFQALREERAREAG